MSFDAFFQSANASALIAVGAVGLFIGAQVIRHWAVYPWHVLGLLFTFGSAYMVVLMIERFREAPLYWQDAAGELVLWWAFVGAMALGYRLSLRNP